MEETVTADNDDNHQMVAINETDGDSNDNEEKDSVTKLKLKSSYRQKYKRAWELDPDLRGKTVMCWLYSSHLSLYLCLFLLFS